MAEAEWSDFKVLLALSRGGSIAAAGRILGVDASTVSRRLAAVERALGGTLVVRGGRDFAFTTEGKAALAAAERMQGLVADAAQAVRKAKTEIEGLVRVSSAPGIVRLLASLPTLLAERHPRLRVEIDSAIGVVDLAQGEADIALRAAKPTDPGLIARRAFEIGFGVYAAKSYADKHGLPSTKDDLRKHRIVLSSRAVARFPHVGWIESYVDGNAHTMRADSLEMLVDLVRSGIGLGVIDCYRGDSSPELVRAFPEPESIVPGWIVTHESQRDTPRIKAVVAALLQHLKEHAAVLSGRR